MDYIYAFIDGLGQYQFLRLGLITSLIIGVIVGIIGPFVILHGLSLLGDAISHAVLPGVALAYIFNVHYTIGATFFGLLTAVLINIISEHSKIKNDAAIGIVFSAFFALGVILIGFANSATNLYHILFGNVLAVRESDVWLTAIVGLGVLIFVLLFYKELKITVFDPTVARSFGLNVRFFDYALILMLTLVAVVSLTSVGTILVVAMLITPAATAYLWTDRLSHMIYLSIIASTLASIVGLFFSYSFNLASGAAIVLTLALFFMISFLFSPKKGLIFTKLRARRAHAS
ncbi:MAG: metal ABC transporter permease [Aerococcus sp.]|nr:metal ABC transporter permease [Aerococcus sp.]